MRKETKILIGIMGVLILALPLMSTAMAAEVSGEGPDESSDAPEGSLRRLLAPCSTRLSLLGFGTEYQEIWVDPRH